MYVDDFLLCGLDEFCTEDFHISGECDDIGGVFFDNLELLLFVIWGFCRDEIEWDFEFFCECFCFF